MLEFSKLGKTWIIDVDGTIVKHNGYKTDGCDTLLEGVKDFFDSLNPEDKIILLTARTKDNVEELKSFLSKNNIHYDYILTDMPFGERILINDVKPSGLNTAYAINKGRDEKLSINYIVNEDL